MGVVTGAAAPQFTIDTLKGMGDTFFVGWQSYVAWTHAGTGAAPQGENKPPRTIVAKSGEFIAIPEKKTVKLKLISGTSDEPDPENPGNFFKLNFKTYFMTLALAQAQNSDELQKKPRDMTIRELKQEIAKLKSDGIDPAPLVTRIHEKIALAFSCVAFVLLGSSLAIITRRREKTINFGIAFLVVGIYYLILMASEAVSLRGAPVIAMWVPNIILGVTGSFLTYKVCAS